MKLILSKLKVYFYSCILLTLLTAAMYTLSFFLDFEADIGYFSEGILSKLSNILAVISLIWIATLFIFVPSLAMSEKLEHSLPTRILALAFSITNLAYAVMRLTGGEGTTFIGYITILFSFVSAVYFLFRARCAVMGAAVSLLGIFPLLRAALAMIEIYLDISIPMNNPVKIFQLLASLSFMLFMLYELRYSAGSSHPRAYFASSLVCALSSAIFSIPFLIMCIFGSVILPTLIPEAIFTLFVPALTLLSAQDCIKSNSVL